MNSAAASVALQWLEARRWVALAVILPIVVAIHLIAAAITIRHSNQDSTASDQGAEMWLAATSREDAVPQRTDGVRHPLWSWLSGRMVGGSAEGIEKSPEFFTRGKWLNTTFCVIFLCVLGMAATRWLDPLAVANLLLLCSMGIFLVRGTYFQPEPLYYILSFAAGVLAWRLLKGGRPWHYLAFGAVGGLAYLSKPSLLPFVLAFGGAFGVRILLAVIRREQSWRPGHNALWMGAGLVLFGILLFPLGRYSKEAFGRPFFNYTKMWMWMDDFETEAQSLQNKYPGGNELKNLPAAERPSLSWYFKRHSVGDAFKRGMSGAGEVTVRFFFPEPKLSGGALFWRSVKGGKWNQPLAQRGVYIIALALLCVALAVMGGRKTVERLGESSSLSFAVFLLVAVGLYVGLYGWYLPIGKGDRFMGSLWAPAVFLLCWWGWILRKDAGSRQGDAAYLAVHTTVLISVLLQVAGLFWKFSQGVYLVTRN